MEKTSTKILRHILNLDLYIASLSLAFLIVLTIAGVAMRYLINRPIYWMEEVQLWCFVWVVFLGSCAVVRGGGHIAIDAIVSLFPMGLRRAAGVLSILTTVVALSFLGYYSCFHVLQMYNRARLTNILGIPLALVYVVVPLSCLVICITCLYQLFTNRLVRKTDYDAPVEEADAETSAAG
jgi:TRAP-type C4-dicarboxylate transport system, small permease component